jgi:hypothetical protein
MPVGRLIGTASTKASKRLARSKEKAICMTVKLTRPRYALCAECYTGKKGRKMKEEKERKRPRPERG